MAEAPARCLFCFLLEKQKGEESSVCSCSKSPPPDKQDASVTISSCKTEQERTNHSSRCFLRIHDGLPVHKSKKGLKPVPKEQASPLAKGAGSH